MKLGSRVIVFGPGMLSHGVAGIVTRVYESGSIDATTFPPGSSTGLCVNSIGSEQTEAYYFKPADPEPLALTIGMGEFAEALKPLIAAAVAAYAEDTVTEEAGHGPRT